MLYYHLKRLAISFITQDMKCFYSLYQSGFISFNLWLLSFRVFGLCKRCCGGVVFHRLFVSLCLSLLLCEILTTVRRLRLRQDVLLFLVIWSGWAGLVFLVPFHLHYTASDITSRCYWGYAGLRFRAFFCAQSFTCEYQVLFLMDRVC